MRERIAIVVLLLVGSGVRSAAADPVAIDLGGIRQARATVTQEDGAWVLTLKMTPIGCFPTSMNDALNRDKARLFGLQALAKHLSGDFPNGITVRGVRVVSAELDGEMYDLTLQVPRDGIEAVPKPNGRVPAGVKMRSRPTGR